jgi:transposase InsO family protein
VGPSRSGRFSDWGLSASFGSTGDAYDNAAMESFWATAKREIEFLHGPVRQLAKSQLRTIQEINTNFHPSSLP